MGKTSKPLLLAVDQRIAHWPEWEALAAQGHTIHVVAMEHDATFGPGCRLMNDHLHGDIDVALKAVRKVRYGVPSNAPDEETSA